MATRFGYTDKDGDLIEGTMAEIGDILFKWHGMRTITDNPEPWLTVDEDGTERPRPAGEVALIEFINWLATADDRPYSDVLDNLVIL